MPERAADFSPLRFSTRDLPERERLTMWREEFGRGMVRVEIEPLSDLPFHAKATLRALPGLRTIACTGSGVCFQRPRAMVADGDDSITLFVDLGSRATASQRGRDVVPAAGDAFLILQNEPAVVTCPPTSFLSVIVPRSALASRVNDIEDASMRLVPRRTEALRLLVSYLRLVRENSVLATPELHNAVVTHVHDLFALAMTPHGIIGESGLSAVAAARVTAALDHVAAHFQEPALSVQKVAKNLGISPRYLQRLLEKSGVSFTARVNELRLQRAFALLSETRDSARRISDIALDAGFSDLSHFNRLFRSRFGDTPSGVRGQAAGINARAQV
jgi:AraC-like DNA-binding protein